MSEQHSHTLAYFKKFAQEWHKKAEGDVPDTVNIVRQRNEGVLRHIEPGSSGKILDVGCGTGELGIAAAERGWRFVGIDFAPEMIWLAEEKRVLGCRHGHHYH